MRPALGQVRAGLARVWSEPLARLLVGALLLVPLLALLVLTQLPAARESPARLVRGPVTVTGSLSPTTALFGDRVEAEIAVYTNDERIDPDSVRVESDFAPYEVVSRQSVRSRQGHVSLLETTFSLSCLTLDCLAPRQGGRVFRFPPLTVSFRQDNRERSLQSAWDPIRVYSRLGENPRLVDAPPALDTGFRVSPTLMQIVLGLLATGLALVGTAFVVAGLWPRFPYSLRLWRRLSPLEQALAQLDAAARIDDEQTRRQVLDQLATRLGEQELTVLERESRALAWGEAAPQPDELALIGERVRTSTNGGSRP
ncbi:MAG TPA: hypothetical protein VH572_05730 [Gaiella sp.]|jgi:hypothetical protein